MQSMPIKQAETLLKRQLKTGQAQRLTLLTQKKDRALTLETQAAAVTVIEAGFVQATRTYDRSAAGTRRAVRVAFQREFPRSHRVYVKVMKY
ncbi:hypothetical protein [Lactiplantibacillus modestisalitolerans]|uniref:50S ribosomal protein L22 n=1 Tax=Lactiplantibacillus modestisalitolerans TaxID=1457219 RepID=A0ABV5WT12_9LACO|nr:hypothetical protein [Lactiplantibacillus modestisalitolerans]